MRRRYDGLRMADKLYLSYRLRGFTESNMLRHWERMLKLFPYSRLVEAGATLLIRPVSDAEPAILERPFAYPVDVTEVLAAAREFDTSDATVELGAHWDLWQFTDDWKLAPTRVTLSCFGPRFESERDAQLQIDLGLDSQFMPQPELPNHLFMARSNIRSLLHLVRELDGALNVEHRRLLTESGENFAARIESALEDVARP